VLTTPRTRRTAREVFELEPDLGALGLGVERDGLRDAELARVGLSRVRGEDGPREPERELGRLEDSTYFGLDIINDDPSGLSEDERASAEPLPDTTKALLDGLTNLCFFEPAMTGSEDGRKKQGCRHAVGTREADQVEVHQELAVAHAAVANEKPAPHVPNSSWAADLVRLPELDDD